MVILPHVHSPSWKFSLHLIHIFRADWKFLTKFDSSDSSFNKSILTLLYLKSETSVRKFQLSINKYYLQVSWHDMDLKDALGILFDKWSLSVILSTWSCNVSYICILVGKFCTILLPNLLHLKVNFIACLNDDISTKKLCIL